MPSIRDTVADAWRAWSVGVDSRHATAMTKGQYRTRLQSPTLLSDSRPLFSGAARADHCLDALASSAFPLQAIALFYTVPRAVQQSNENRRGSLRCQGRSTWRQVPGAVTEVRKCFPTAVLKCRCSTDGAPHPRRQLGSSQQPKPPGGLARPLPVAVAQHSALSDSLQPCGPQHARLPCPSPPPRACSNSCPLSR